MEEMPKVFFNDSDSEEFSDGIEDEFSRANNEEDKVAVAEPHFTV